MRLLNIHQPHWLLSPEKIWHPAFKKIYIKWIKEKKILGLKYKKKTYMKFNTTNTRKKG